MRKKVLFIAVVTFAVMGMLAGCKKKKETDAPEPLKPIEPYGELTEDFRTIVAENRFYCVQAGRDKLYRTTENPDAKGTTVKVMDFAGNELSQTEFPTDKGHHFRLSAETTDGGFIAAVGFSDYVDCEKNHWASMDGVISTVYKCGADGKIEWKLPLFEISGPAFRFFEETEDAYFIFGEIETPETKVLGVGSPSDIFAIRLSKDGKEEKRTTIGGTDYDMLESVRAEENGFLLTVNAQSIDGDFSGGYEGRHPYATGWDVHLDRELNIRAKENYETVINVAGERIGYLNGKAVYADDPAVLNKQEGSLSAVIDYGDSYLLISENPTGIFERTPMMISALWYYSETVYGFYDKEGRLLWKTAVDSSPDFEERLKDFDMNIPRPTVD